MKIFDKIFGQVRETAAKTAEGVAGRSRLVTEAARRKFTELPGALDAFGKHFSESAMWRKIGAVAAKAGKNVVYMALTLFYGLEKASLKDKAMIVGALGYFIFPADLIPDFIPLGFADDMGALMAVYGIVKNSIGPEAHERARRKLGQWFENPEIDPSVLPSDEP